MPPQAPEQSRLLAPAWLSMLPPPRTQGASTGKTPKLAIVQRRAEPPQLERWGQKETGVWSPWSRNPCRGEEEISKDSEYWKLKYSRGTLSPCWAELPWQKIELERWEEWGPHGGCNRTQIGALELAWQGLRGQEYRRDLGSETNTVALEESSKIQKAKPEEQRLEAIKWLRKSKQE